MIEILVDKFIICTTLTFTQVKKKKLRLNMINNNEEKNNCKVYVTFEILWKIFEILKDARILLNVFLFNKLLIIIQINMQLAILIQRLTF